MKKLKFILVVFSLLSLYSCGKGEKQTELPQWQNEVLINGVNYELSSGSTLFFEGYYSVAEKDCVCLYITFVGGARITIEMSRELLGKHVPITSSDEFWWFSIDDNREYYLQMDNYDEDFDDNSGWFSIDLEEKTGEVIFEWELNKIAPYGVGTLQITKGYIKDNSTKINHPIVRMLKDHSLIYLDYEHKVTALSYELFSMEDIGSPGYPGGDFLKVNISLENNQEIELTISEKLVGRGSVPFEYSEDFWKFEVYYGHSLAHYYASNDLNTDFEKNTGSINVSFGELPNQIILDIDVIFDNLEGFPFHTTFPLFDVHIDDLFLEIHGSR